jgi:hypothetical protein
MGLFTWARMINGNALARATLGRPLDFQDHEDIRGCRHAACRQRVAVGRLGVASVAATTGRD